MPKNFMKKATYTSWDEGYKNTDVIIIQEFEFNNTKYATIKLELNLGINPENDVLLSVPMTRLTIIH